MLNGHDNSEPEYIIEGTVEMFQHMLTMAMIGQYMTGLNVGAALPEDMRDDCHEEVGLIGDILGFDAEEVDET